MQAIRVCIAISSKHINLHRFGVCRVVFERFPRLARIDTTNHRICVCALIQNLPPPIENNKIQFVCLRALTPVRSAIFKDIRDFV